MNTYLNMLACHYSAAAGPAACADRSLLPAAAGDVFGALSQRAAEGVEMAEGSADAVNEVFAAAGFSSTVPFHAAVLLLLVCYVLVLYRHPELLKNLREHIFSAGAVRDDMNDNRHDPMRGLSWGCLLLDILFVCTAAVRLTDMADPAAAAAMPLAARMLAVPVAAALFCMVAAFQSSLLALSGTVTVSRPLTSALARIRNIYFRLATVVLTPVLLLWALSPAGRGQTFAIIIAVELLLIVLAFLRETFLLFISKKLSIYHWFLYLCTVEAFPLSLICLLAARG